MSKTINPHPQNTSSISREALGRCCSKGGGGVKNIRKKNYAPPPRPYLPMTENDQIFFTYSQFHKTLPKPSLQMHWISVRFYEKGDI